MSNVVILGNGDDMMITELAVMLSLVYLLVYSW